MHCGTEPRVVVLTLPGSYQRVGGPASVERRDPNLGSVIPALADAGLEPVVIGLGMSRQRDEDWPPTELDDRLLPAFYLQSRWARPEDRDRARCGLSTRRSRASTRSADVPFELDGLDMTMPFAGCAPGHAPDGSSNRTSCNWRVSSALPTRSGRRRS